MMGLGMQNTPEEEITEKFTFEDFIAFTDPYSGKPLIPETMKTLSDGYTYNFETLFTLAVTGISPVTGEALVKNVNGLIAFDNQGLKNAITDDDSIPNQLIKLNAANTSIGGQAAQLLNSAKQNLSRGQIMYAVQHNLQHASATTQALLIQQFAGKLEDNITWDTIKQRISTRILNPQIPIHTLAFIMAQTLPQQAIDEEKTVDFMECPISCKVHDLDCRLLADGLTRNADETLKAAPNYYANWFDSSVALPKIEFPNYQLLMAMQLYLTLAEQLTNTITSGLEETKSSSDLAELVFIAAINAEQKYLTQTNKDRSDLSRIKCLKEGLLNATDDTAAGKVLYDHFKGKGFNSRLFFRWARVYDHSFDTYLLQEMNVTDNRTSGVLKKLNSDSLPINDTIQREAAKKELQTCLARQYLPQTDFSCGCSGG